MYDNAFANSGGGQSDFVVSAFFWVVAIAIYLYFAYMQYRMAHKTGNSDTAWWSFVPIMNTLLLINMARKPLWWFFLLLVPFVNIVAFCMLWWQTAKHCNQPGFWGILMMLPFLNFVSAFVLAFNSKPYVYPDEATQGPENKPKTPQQVG